MNEVDGTTPKLPGENLRAEKMPGHWVLAQMGKRVLRPGGLELTRLMLDALDIQSTDEVVEFAPGLGTTARMTLSRCPASYIAVERDEDAAAHVRRTFLEPSQSVRIGRAEDTGLPDASATVVYGEAMLTMQPDTHKRQILGEAHRVLKAGGRYAVHEICMVPDEIESSLRDEIHRELAMVVHSSVKPLPLPEWRALMEDVGFQIKCLETTDMALLEPKRIIADEGIFGALKFLGNVLRNSAARRRVLGMRRIFRKYRSHLGAFTMVCTKRE